MSNANNGYGKIAVVVFAYFTVSIAMVFVNKVLLTEAPIFITWFQCLLTSLICWALGLLNRAHPAFAEFPAQTYNLHTAKAVAPLSLIFVGMVTFNNLCLQYVEVSFYNVARSLTIVMNVIFTYFMLGQTTSRKTLVTLALVIIGFFVGADGEVNFSLVGTLFGVASSCFVSLNGIYTKKVLPAVHDDKWRLGFYNNTNAMLMFVPLLFAMGEHRIIAAHAELIASTAFWVLMMVAGVLGFLINIVTVMQISLTSPLTHNISGTAKACVQTLLALYIWQNPTTPKAMFGVFMVIFGSLLYTYVKMEEDKQAQSGRVQYQKVPTQEKELIPAEEEDDVELGNVATSSSATFKAGGGGSAGPIARP